MTPEQQQLADACTNLQRLTVLGVIAGKTQRQAYYDAGGKAATDEAADTSAYEIMSKPEPKAFYDSLLAEAVDKAIMTRSQALARLSLVADTRITDILEFETVDVSSDDGENKTETIWRMKESVELQERAAASIKSVTMTKFGPKIEMYDATAAIGQMAKMQGWDAPTKSEITGANGLPIGVAILSPEAYKQARKDMMGDDDC